MTPTPATQLRELLVGYCANQIAAKARSEISWSGLAERLGVEEEELAEVAGELDGLDSAGDRGDSLDSAPSEGDAAGPFWQEVINERIAQALRSPLFQDQSWQRLEGGAMTRLIQLVEAGRVRDPAELLAIAIQARKVSRAEGAGSNGRPHLHGINVQINNGTGVDMNGNSLPAAGTQMQIDLSPRLAKRLTVPERLRNDASRVIDGDMLNAEELRELAREPATQEELTEAMDSFQPASTANNLSRAQSGRQRGLQMGPAESPTESDLDDVADVIRRDGRYGVVEGYEAVKALIDEMDSGA